jgi:uncharacterized protein (TIGR02757 family)
MEVAALLSAALAYGRVRQIEKDLNDLFTRTGPSPYRFVLNFNKTKRQKLDSFKHRFTTGADIADLLSALKIVLRRKGTIEKFFLLGCNKNDENIIRALSTFCTSLHDIHSKQNGHRVSTGLRYLLPDPAAGSACKRLNLFLRWMVRHDDVDPGLWKELDKAKLLVPVDVHMARLSRILGFHNKNTVSLSTAVQLTKAFARIAPSDPAKYDFALSRVGITDGCTAKPHKRCNACQLQQFCRPERTDA